MSDISVSDYFGKRVASSAIIEEEGGLGYVVDRTGSVMLMTRDEAEYMPYAFCFVAMDKEDDYYVMRPNCKVMTCKNATSRESTWVELARVNNEGLLEK
jgi:hypothetical protein